MHIFRLSTARTKINQIPYVTLNPQVSFHLNLATPFSVTNPLKVSNWNSICFGQKDPSMYNFQTFGYSNNESSPNSSCHFWNHKVRVFQILHHCSVPWKITLKYFLSSNLIFWTKIAHGSKIFGLLSGWVKIHQIPYVIIETTSQFFF